MLLRKITEFFKRLLGLQSETLAGGGGGSLPPIVAFLVALAKDEQLRQLWTHEGRKAAVDAWPGRSTLGSGDYDLLVNGTFDQVKDRVTQLGHTGAGQMIWICIWIR